MEDSLRNTEYESISSKEEAIKAGLDFYRSGFLLVYAKDYTKESKIESEELLRYLLKGWRPKICSVHNLVLHPPYALPNARDVCFVLDPLHHNLLNPGGLCRIRISTFNI